MNIEGKSAVTSADWFVRRDAWASSKRSSSDRHQIKPGDVGRKLSLKFKCSFYSASHRPPSNDASEITHSDDLHLSYALIAHSIVDKRVANHGRCGRRTQNFKSNEWDPGGEVEGRGMYEEEEEGCERKEARVQHRGRRRGSDNGLIGHMNEFFRWCWNVFGRFST